MRAAGGDASESAPKDHELLDDETVVDETDLARFPLHLCRLNNEDPRGSTPRTRCTTFSGADRHPRVASRAPARSVTAQHENGPAASSQIMLLLTVSMTCTPVVAHEPRDLNSELQSDLTTSDRLGLTVNARCTAACAPASDAGHAHRGQGAADDGFRGGDEAVDAWNLESLADFQADGVDDYRQQTNADAL